MKKVLFLLTVCVFLISCTMGEDVPTSLTEYYQGVDFSCTTDADCVVKDVHNCCGYFPQCVNKDFKTVPEIVNTLCTDEEVFSVCGFEDITSCGCIEGRCIDNP